MSKICELTGRRPTVGNTVSHSNIKTRTRWLPNLKSKKYFVAPLKESITLKLSTRAIKTVDKLGGIVPAVLKAKDNDLSPRLQRLKAKLRKN